MTPVVFFAFRRPAHTRQALAALTRNAIPEGTPLYAFVDGAREHSVSGELDQIAEVRSILDDLAWPGPKYLHYRRDNVGLLKSLLWGITDVLSKHEAAIVVEDDVVPSRGFYEFLAEGLTIYADEPRVMHLSAHSPFDAPPADYPHTTFVFNHSSVGWGWATWRRAWSKLTTDGAQMRREIARRRLRHYVNLDGTFEIDYALQVLDEGRSQDWNAYWHCSIILNGGVCIHPVKSLAKNVGFDGSGTQCTTDSEGLLTPTVDRLSIEKIELIEWPQLRSLALKGRMKNRFEIAARCYARAIRNLFRRSSVRANLSV